MPGLLLPDDDLYARLGLEPEATPEAIELAWRALLRRHHPDVAGETAEALETAKRINVAHDWLANPELRARYDREVMGLEPLPVPGGGRGGRGMGGPLGFGRRARPWPIHPAAPRKPRPRPSNRPDLTRGEPEIRLARFMDRVRRLTPDELDRMAAAEPPPIAFEATVRRFAPPDAGAELDKVQAELEGVLPRERWVETGIREGLTSVATEIVLAPFLDDMLAEPFRSRARDRLLRAWDASLEQPRWGPNGAEVGVLRARVALMTPAEADAFVQASRDVPEDDWPWPEALPVDRLPAPIATRTGRLIARQGHVTALRHAFPAAEYQRLVAPFGETVGGGRSSVRERSTGPDIRRAR